MSGNRACSPEHLLFVYGTLAPGEENAHILAPLGGSWEPATVFGSVHPEGWGATHGFPGLRLGDGPDKVSGLLFFSPALEQFWPELDEFEGSDYRRAQALVMLEDDSQFMANVYIISD